MNQRSLLHALIAATAAGHLLFFAGVTPLLDLFVLALLLNSLIALAVLAWIRPAPAEEARHRTLLREEEEWWRTRQAVRREQR